MEAAAAKTEGGNGRTAYVAGNSTAACMENVDNTVVDNTANTLLYFNNEEQALKRTFRIG